MSDDYDVEVQRLAQAIVDKVHAAFWPTTPEERATGGALDDDIVIACVSDPANYSTLELYDDVVSMACVLLEPSEGVTLTWIPKPLTDTLDEAIADRSVTRARS
jgi:hypothetical protein